MKEKYARVNSQTVYLGLSAGFIHHGHIRLISAAATYGEVIIGLLTDSAIYGHKRLPYLNFENRKEILLGLRGVARVIEQNEWDYSNNILKLQPNFFIHGDDWNTELAIPNGGGASLKEKALAALSTYGGVLIEIPHTPGIKLGNYDRDSWMEIGTPEIRSQELRRVLLANKALGKISRAIETHSPLSALIAESSEINIDGTKKYFDAFWCSSLTDSTLLGKPDTESLDLSTRLANAERIIAKTSRPVIYDGDTGGRIEHFNSMVKSVERVGVSGIVVEDKVGFKQNSLLGTTVEQNQASIAEFVDKIKVGKSAQVSRGFMLIARIESLIMDKPLRDALHRADEYVGAGADGIFISSRSNEPDEVIEFAQEFRRIHHEIPLFVVPSTYSKVYEKNLHLNGGIDLVIYANHLLRSTIPAMRKTALTILKNGRSLEAESDGMLTIKEILDLIPGIEN